MAQVKPQAPPGFLSQATQVQARGGWYAGNLVRWRTGILEKWAGWKRLIEEALPAIIRRMHAWLDIDSKKNLLIATDTGVHLLVQDTLYGLGREIDLQGGFIPEIGPIGALTKFSVAINSTEVTVKTAAVASVGGTFLLRLPISIGGRIILSGAFLKVKSVIPTVGFTFDMPQPALVAETDVYGIPLLTNDIVNAFTVTWKAHGLIVGAQVRITLPTSIKLGASGVWEKLKFEAPAGTVVTVDTVPDADHFTFKMGTLGTGDGTGASDHQIYLGSKIEHPTGGVITATAGTVIGLAVQTPLGNPQRQSWFLGNQGKNGLVLASGGPLQVYKPPIQDGPFLAPVSVLSTGTPPVETVPQKSHGMLTTMPQGQVILWGSEAEIGKGVIDPLMIRWSDAGTYDEYIATVSNQAGSFRLSRGSRIVGAIQAPQATLILTDTDLWQMSYIGPPLIYGFAIMGAGCGLVAPHAIATLGRLTIWQGQKNFWQYDTAVQPVMCTVWDYIFEDLDSVNLNKCHAAPNSTTNEMAFYFASKHTLIDVDRNLLLFSQQFDDLTRWKLTNALAQRFSVYKTLYVYEPQYVISGWFMDAGLSPVSWWDRDIQSELENLIFAPDGSDTTFLLSETAVNGTHSVSQTIDKAGERITYTLSIYAHDSSTRNLTLRAVASLGEAYATFDVTTGNVLASGVSTPRFALLTATVLTDALATDRLTPTSNGWRRYVLSFTSDDSPTLELFFHITKGTELSYMGEPPKGVLIWGAQLVLGADPLPYEKTEGTQRQNETRFYVKVNTAEGMAWDSGRIGRSAWLDESVWGTPLGADITALPPPRGVVVPAFTGAPRTPPRNLIQQHEIGFDDDLDPMVGVFAETGMTELGDGTMMMLIDQCQPDLKWFGRDGAVNVSLRAANYAQGPKHLFGPWSMTPETQWFNPRVRTHYVSVRYDWQALRGFSARVGLTTFHVKPCGRMP